MTNESAESTGVAPKRRGVRLTHEEAWAMLHSNHTGIFTSLRRDGVPIALPVWYAVIDGNVYMTTPGQSKKVARIRHDSRSSFLVESGLKWAELKAVHLTGTASILDVEAESAIADQVRDQLDTKYVAYRTAPRAMSDATRKHYGSSSLVRFVPDERIVSWNNALLGLS